MKVGNKMGIKNLDNSKDANSGNLLGSANTITTTITTTGSEITDPLAPYDDSYGLRNPNSEGEQPDANNSTELAKEAGNVIGSDGKNHNPNPTVDVSGSGDHGKTKTGEKRYKVLHTGIGGLPSGDMVLENQIVSESGLEGVSIARLLELKAIEEYKGE